MPSAVRSSTKLSRFFIVFFPTDCPRGMLSSSRALGLAQFSRECLRRAKIRRISSSFVSFFFHLADYFFPIRRIFPFFCLILPSFFGASAAIGSTSLGRYFCRLFFRFLRHVIFIFILVDSLIFSEQWLIRRPRFVCPSGN